MVQRVNVGVSDDPSGDVCKCNHVRFIHRPRCDGKYASGEWIGNSDRDCNCQIFVLDYIYKDPPSCPTCGREYDDD